jgi:L-fuculose-phosphate aldolase/L-ribulose-5-phosphate 4-epimerase
VNEYKGLKLAMRKAAKRAYDIRLQSGDGGNLSVRIAGEELILIKSSGYSFGDMGDENIVLVDFDGNIVSGDKNPSREILTHVAIYRERKDVTAIFHSHSPWSVAIAQNTTFLPPVSLPLEMKIGNVPILNIGDSHADDDVANAVQVLLKENLGIKAFIQSRHGIFSLSTDIIKAEHNAELVEEAAQIALLSKISLAI